MNPKIKNHKAFSLIEMSIVILVIGVIIATITGSSIAIDKYRLTLARSITESSPVTITKGLKLWYDTTTKKSFLDTETGNGLTVNTWYDRNTISNAKRNTTSGVGATYTTNCVNYLPCLRFNGTSNYYYFDGSFLVNTDFTIFVVEQRRSNVDGNWFISGDAGSTNTNLVLGYVYNDTIRFAMWANDIDAGVSSYSVPTPKIHVFALSSDYGKSYYLNGTLTGSDGSQTSYLTSFANSSIGKSNVSNFYYNGDICEIIMFDRNLTNEERRNIEAYLSQKWKIAVS